MSRLLSFSALVLLCHGIVGDKTSIQIQFSASNLIDLDAYEGPNPYLEILYAGRKDANFTLMRKTMVIPACYDCIWSDMVPLIVIENSTQRLQINVLDADVENLYGDESLGMVVVPLEDLLLPAGHTVFFDLITGRLNIHIMDNVAM